MLSGIGDQVKLSAKNIHVVSDLPGVGNNLRNHPLVLLNFETLKPFPNAYQASNFMIQYMTTKTGPVAYPGAAGVAFLKSNNGNALLKLFFAYLKHLRSLIFIHLCYLLILLEFFPTRLFQF
jgi:choline dehydrogenase-like flavoprotein